MGATIRTYVLSRWLLDAHGKAGKDFMRRHVERARADKWEATAAYIRNERVKRDWNDLHLAGKLDAAAIDAVDKEKWTSKADVMLKQIRAADKTALHNGDTKAQYAGYEGMMFVNARNPVRPTALDADKTPLQATDGRIYAGCYVNAVLEFWAQDNKFGKRVNATLMGVQFFRDGDAFSGGGAASDDDFDDVTAGAESGDFV